jgi:hypothetical protein
MRMLCVVTISAPVFFIDAFCRILTVLFRLLPLDFLNSVYRHRYYTHHHIHTQSQAHLCPLPLQIAPIFWAFDHALALYPAPDGLVLADSVDQYRTSYNQVWSGENKVKTVCPCV